MARPFLCIFESVIFESLSHFKTRFVGAIRISGHRVRVFSISFNLAYLIKVYWL